ncbi:hypothetical protein [Kordiimonas aestuarii]|uniref:hypothetical protein n=1 Tax=Kordiimonas aestuarii TaxID=1005925 RepID=UPI0021D02727|nr:hypothetical protein [Kordiimonas aestuarii]
MDNNTLAIYIHELRNQCLHAEASFSIFNQAMANKAGAGILYGGQSILIPGSQISSLLWPTRARARSRGEALRKVLGLNEKHPLNDRRLCELWERSDEKFEEWVNQTKGQQVIFDLVGDPSQVGDGDIKDECVYRAYNPTTRVYWYRGVAYNLQAVANALTDVAKRVNTIYAQMFPEQAKADAEARRRAADAQQTAQVAADAQASAANDASGDEKPGEKPAAKKAAPKKKAAAKKAPAKKSSKSE